MESEHTPGTAGPFKVPYTHPTQVTTEHGLVVAICQAGNGISLVQACKNAEFFANAPTALQEAKAEIEALKGTDSDTVKFYMDVEKRLTQQLAEAKAREDRLVGLLRLVYNHWHTGAISFGPDLELDLFENIEQALAGTEVGLKETQWCACDNFTEMVEILELATSKGLAKKTVLTILSFHDGITGFIVCNGLVEPIYIDIEAKPEDVAIHRQIPPAQFRAAILNTKGDAR